MSDAPGLEGRPRFNFHYIRAAQDLLGVGAPLPVLAEMVRPVWTEGQVRAYLKDRTQRPRRDHMEDPALWSALMGLLALLDARQRNSKDDGE